MGIDVYLKWNGQTEEEKKAQYTGFSTLHGHVGYLREAYHGRPYATRVLAPEAFETEHTCNTTMGVPGGCEGCKGARIPFATLEERLPRVIFATLCRDLMLYQGAAEKPKPMDFLDPGLVLALLSKVKEAQLAPTDFENDLPPEVLAAAATQMMMGIKFGWWPPFAMSYVQFVALHKKLEVEGKEPRIYASY